ncbi:hypothetical protein PVAP13_9KG132685, partial [Panicum virgatum]
ILAPRNSSPRLAPDTAAAYTSRAASRAPPSRLRSSAPTTHLPARDPGPPPTHPIPSRGDRDPHSCRALTAGTRTARRPPSPPSSKSLPRARASPTTPLRTAPHWVWT